jgi:F-type H+-transporting ATPase subunit epsilon
MGHFNVKILTPTRVIAKAEQADAITVPSVRGQIQILPEHTHLVTQIEVGILIIYHGEKKPSFFLIQDGICRVVGKDVIFLVQSCETSSGMTLEKAEEIYLSSQKDLQQFSQYADEYPANYKNMRLAQERVALLKAFQAQ